MKIKRLCKLSCVEKVDVGPFGIVITIRSKEVSDPSKILNAITKNPGWRLRENQTILIKGNFEKAEVRLAKTLKVIQSLYEKLK
jgi:transcription-repair coupling factor (superfamily II helicase)